MSSFRGFLFSSVVSVASLAATFSAYAETLNGALAKAYKNNATINSARAGVRVADENVAIAKSGYRPTITGNLSWQYTSASEVTKLNPSGFRSKVAGDTGISTVSITLNQTIFDGFRTTNNVKSAKSGVLAQRENLRNSTQTILFDGVQAFMDVIRTRRIAELRAKNIEFLTEQLRAARVRLEVGEGTRTDVAQAEASLAGAQAELNLAKADLASAEAVYQQIVGEKPGKLSSPKPFARVSTNFDKALGIAMGSHPAIRAQQHAADALSFNVKVAEGELLPTLSAEASVARRDTLNDPSLRTTSTSEEDIATVGLNLRVPIYQGGRVAATVRQAKERLGQGQIEIDVFRDRVRAAVASSTSQYTASAASVIANRELVRAARLALDGVVEERRVGQRTTLDVLNAQADLITAQINQVNAEADSVVASYAILSATGQLEPKKLALNVREHKPEEHYEAVKDMWFGLRTPDGR